MTNRKKKFYTILLLFIVIGGGYWIWRINQPIVIVNIYHEESNFSSVVVKNPPLTQRGLITWWENNKEAIHDHYDVPKPDEEGEFRIALWDIGNGYEEFDELEAKQPFRGNSADLDQFCFEDIKTKRNCLHKDKRFGSVRKSARGRISYVLHGKEFYLGKDGSIVDIKW